MNKEVIKNLKKTENLYRLQIRDMVVEIEYSEENKKLDECMIKILRQKLKYK